MSNIMLDFLIIYGIIMAILSFYDAFRIQVYRGVAESSKISAIFVMLFLVIQLFLEGKEALGVNSILLMVIIASTVMIILFVKIYVNGRSIIIYRTSRAIVIERTRTQLQNLSVSFSEEEGINSDDYFFRLDENVSLKISSNGLGLNPKDYRLTIKKWWKLPNYKDMKENLIYQYREEREGEIFWKELLFNIGFGFLTLLFIYYMVQKFK